MFTTERHPITYCDYNCNDVTSTLSIYGSYINYKLLFSTMIDNSLCWLKSMQCLQISGHVKMVVFGRYRIRGYFRWVDIFVESTDPRTFNPFKFLAVWILINTWSSVHEKKSPRNLIPQSFYHSKISTCSLSLTSKNPILLLH